VDNPDNLIDMTISDYATTFWGIHFNGDLVGVNSGHRTAQNQYRSRGLWVDPMCRGQGLAQLLLTVTLWQARREGCEMAWSIPRQSALHSYTSQGFQTVGEFFATETSPSNIYVKINL
jgi:GNAT superfamily N-acetyltransferase